MSRVLLLTGPAGSGKSSAAVAWASRGTSPRAAIDADALRLLVHAGRVYPEHGWNDENQRQWDTAMDLWKAMVRVYRNREIDCVVDLYAPPCVDAEGDAFMAELGMQRVVLLPSFEVCRERNRVRAREPFLAESELRGNYDDFLHCVRLSRPANVLDNGPLSVDQTVDAIESLIS